MNEEEKNSKDQRTVQYKKSGFMGLVSVVAMVGGIVWSHQVD